MVQKYQSEITPIFYYFTAPWLKKSLLNVPVFINNAWKILSSAPGRRLRGPPRRVPGRPGRGGGGGWRPRPRPATPTPPSTTASTACPDRPASCASSRKPLRFFTAKIHLSLQLSIKIEFEGSWHGEASGHPRRVHEDNYGQQLQEARDILHTGAGGGHNNLLFWMMMQIFLAARAAH